MGQNAPQSRLSTPCPATFTAGQIGAALGKPARSVRRELAGTAADGTSIVGGNLAQTWSISSLPANLRLALSAEARRRGYPSDEHLLAHLPRRWEPPLPLSSFEPEAVADASRLQKALRPTLGRLADTCIARGDIVRLGVADYSAVFGRGISERQFNRLLKRTLDRDAGAEEWDRLELYLSERAAPRRTPVIALGLCGYWTGMLAIAAQVRDMSKPSVEELACFWDEACSALTLAVEHGMPERRARREIRKTIEQKVPFIRSRGRALEKKIRRALGKWEAGGRNANAVVDQRSENSGRSKPVELPAAFKDMLLARCHQNNGRMAQSWREAIKEGWMPDQVAAAYPFGWDRKSYLPAAVRRAIGPDLKRLAPYRIGPKNARLRGAYIQRDYSGTPAGKIFSCDDCTAPIWFWVSDEHGRPVLDRNGSPVLTRGQWLPWVCVRSHYIVTFQLIPEKGYDSIDILRGISLLHDEYGLPEELQFENGIWRAALIDGTIKGRGTWAEFKLGLGSVGVSVRHTRPQNPRAKIIENVLGQLQNRMDRLRGYAGRRPEQCPEDTKRHLQLVLRGEAHPAEYFYSHIEAARQYERICNEFNHEPQNGEMLAGLSPQQAFVQFCESPPIKLEPQQRYLLARSRVETTVTRNGIRIGKFLYKGEHASALIGERVLAWFNAEDPESICVTDLAQQNPFTLGRAAAVPAFDATPDEIERAERENAAQTKYPRTLIGRLHHDFPQEFQRCRRNVVIAPPEVNALGTEMEAQRQEISEAARQAESQRKQAERHARNIGLSGAGTRIDAEKLTALAHLERAGVKAVSPYADPP